MVPSHAVDTSGQGSLLEPEKKPVYDNGVDRLMGKGSSPPPPNYEKPKPISAPVDDTPKDMTAQKRGTPLAQRTPDPVAAQLLEEEERKTGLLS